MNEPLRILVVDGDPVRRAACEVHLRGLAASVDVSATPVEAMGRLVRATAPAITLLMVSADLTGMGATLFVRAARSLPGRALLPVVLTGPGTLVGELPRSARVVEPAAEALRTAFAALQVAAPVSTAPQRLLVVDDHEVNRIIMVRMLDQLGIACDTAVDGIDALAKVGRQRYALVFMDCEMPRMDGLEATRAIRRLESGRGGHTPVVACTSRNLPEDREAGLAAGMDDYLIKPVSYETVASQVERWMGCRIASATAHASSPPASAPIPASEPPVELPLLERTVFDRIRGYGPEVVATTIERFLAELGERLAELERLATGDDDEPLRQRAHAWKGVAGSLGAKRLWQVLAAIESAARSGESAQARAQVKSLPPLVEATAGAMRQALA